MKWIYLFGLLLMAPALAALLGSHRRYLIPTCFLLGASLLLLGPSLLASPIGWPMWPSTVKGTEVSFVDAISIGLLAVTRPTRVPLSLKLSFAIVSLALAVSTAIAYNPIAALFYVWEFLRATLLFLAIARVCGTEPRAATAIVAGLGVAMIGEAIWVALQYVQGSERPGGSLGHSNTFGIAADFVVFPAAALMLGSRRWFWPGATVFSGFICVVLGGSRASMGLFAIGTLLTTALSIVHRSTSRKYAFLGVMALLLLVCAPVMIWSAGRRSEEATASSDQQRAAMKEAASMIIADHPLGIGANQYAVVSNVGGYSARAGVAWNEENRRAPVHDSYYLVTAEMGFLGLVGMLSIFGSLIMVGFWSLRRHLPDESGELVPGLLATMIVVAIHISFEFSFMDAILHYLFATSAGLLVAIAARAKALVGKPATISVAGGLSHAT